MRVIVLVIAIGLSFMGVSAEVDAATRLPTNIGAQELAPALHLLARERGIQFVYRSELVADRWTDGVTGNLTFEEAMVQLLNETGLTYRYLAEKAITIVPAVSGDVPSAGKIVAAAEAGSRGKSSSP